MLAYCTELIDSSKGHSRQTHIEKCPCYYQLSPALIGH